MRIKDSRKSHFFWAHDDIFDTWGEILKPNGIAIYLCLVRHADCDGICYPSFGTIAKKCGVSRSTVIRTIDKLVEFGLIKREQRFVEHKQPKGKEKTSNLYTILDLPALPSVTETLPQCQGDTTPSVTEILPQCQGDTTPSVTETPKGRHRQKENLTKGRHTDKDSIKPENNVVRQSSVDLNFSNFNWPKNLSKTQPVIMALAQLPDDCARQQVLDVVSQALEKSTVEKPIAFLRKVVKNYLDGDFTPIEKPETNPTQQSINNGEARLKPKIRAEDCPYCNERGLIEVISKHNGPHDFLICHHDPDEIKKLALKRDAWIRSAKPGYEDPASPQQGNGLKKIGAILSSQFSREDDYDDVPF